MREPADDGPSLHERVATPGDERRRLEEAELTELRAGDVVELARIHRRAFSGFFLAQLGEGFLQEFYRAFVGEPSAVAVVARRGGRPVGVVVGTVEPAGFYRRLLQRRWYGFARAAAVSAIRQPSAVPRLARAVCYRGQAPEQLPGAALLASLCVNPDDAGQGIGARLTHAWSLRAAALGARHAYLSTDLEDNEGVNRHYQRHGWRLESTYTTPEGRRMNRYVKDLEPDAGDPSSQGPR